MQRRLRYVCIGSLICVPFILVINLLLRQWTTLGLAAVTLLIAALAYWQATARDLSREQSARWLFAIWLVGAASAMTAFIESQTTRPGLWQALLLLGYMAAQLQARWVWAAIVIGTIGWSGMLLILNPADIWLQFLGIASTLATGGFIFKANVSLVRDSLTFRELDAQRQQRLAEALAAAQRELTERQQAELERDRLREQFIESQRLEAVGRLAGGVAHDINNILTSVSTLAGLMRRDSRPELMLDLDAVEQACTRGAALTGSLLGFSRRAQYAKADLSLSTIADDAQRILGRTLRKNITLERPPADARIWVHADRNHLVQVLVNLCLNSERAITGSGTIRIMVGRERVGDDRAASLQIEAGEYACLAVQDDGKGMDEATRRQAFEPFFTTRAINEGSGLGLGLAMAYGTVRAHGGAITIDSEPEKGTRVRCLFPLRQSAQQLNPDAGTDTGTDTGTGTGTDAGPDTGTGTGTGAGIGAGPAARAGADAVAATGHHQRGALLIDDERLVRYSTTRLLEGAGLRVFAAEDGQHGLETFVRHRHEIDLVLLDMSMPRMNGEECFRWLRRLDPCLPIVCMSGLPLPTSLIEFAGEALVSISKPFSQEQLHAAITKAQGQVIQVIDSARKPQPDPSTHG